MVAEFRRRLGPLLEPTPVARLIRQTSRRQWRLLVVNFATSLFEAFSEGASLAVVFLAVQVLASSGSIDWATNPLISRSAALTSLLQGIPRTPLFLLLLSLALLLQLLQSGTRYLNALSVSYFSARCTRLITAELHSRILSFSFPCASGYRVGDLTDVAGGGPGAVGIVIGYYNQLLLNGLLIALYLAVLVSLSPWLVIIAVAMAAAILLIQRQLLPRIRQTAHRVSEAQMQIAVRLTEDIQGLRLLHSSGQLQQAQRGMGQRMQELEHSLRRRSQLTELIGPITGFLPMLAICVIGAGSVLFFGGKTSGILPSLVTFVLALQRLNGRLGSTAGVFTYLASLSGTLSRLNNLLTPEDKRFVRQGGEQCPGLRKQIHLAGITLRYHQDGPLALNAIDLVIPRGNTIALVGPSGSGKSSIADLLVGLYDPSEGSVLLDGKDLRSFDLASWQRRLGVVSQDTFLFNATIAENIAYGVPEASEGDIVAACVAAQCAGFIGALPDGYNTLVGERGYRLSGGQRQRLSLARAILRNPDLLILDEATSALDSQNERLVQNAIRRLQVNRTVLIIAHRLSTVVHADKIIVLREGEIIQRGNHTTLMRADGLYRRLWLEQSQQAEIDEHTGVWNRSQILALLERSIQECRRYGVQLSLMLLQLDPLSDASGVLHPLTREAMHGLTRLLRERLRDTDAIGALDPHQLLLVMPHTAIHDAEVLSADLVRLLQAAQLPDAVRVQVHVGLTHWTEGDISTELLLRAEWSLHGHAEPLQLLAEQP
ncbi:MAG: ATP-binding cassette domain-containing protein [Cyanobium sp.]|nr:ATP-binding cassette domain-containing protein [Cyanobium sp.]